MSYQKNTLEHAPPPIFKVGWLSKQSGFFKTFKRRWMVIQGNSVVYYNDYTQMDKRGDILLSQTTIQPFTSPGKLYCIKIQSIRTNASKSVYCLCTNSLEEQQDWINALIRASFWEPGEMLLNPNGRIKEDLLKMSIKGMMDHEYCFNQVREILSECQANQKGINNIEFDTDGEMIVIQGVFSRIEIIRFLEKEGYFVYIEEV